MRTVTNSMGQVVKGMDRAMESMNLERVSVTRAQRAVSRGADLASPIAILCAATAFWDDTLLLYTSKSHRSLCSRDQISLVMDKFESQFADLDVQTSYMESTMSDTTALATPQDQVDSLINQVADEAGLEVEHGLGEAKVPNAVPAQSVAEKEAPLEEDGRLAERLRALRVSP